MLCTSLKLYYLCILFLYQIYMELLSVLPVEIVQVILKFSDFLSQIRLTQLSRYLHKNLKIYDFYDIDSKYLRLLSNDIIKNYKHIKKLNINCSNITNEGISHLNLHTLNTGSNSLITDEGILHMKLYTL